MLVASCALLPAAYYPYAQSFAAYLNGAGGPNPYVLWGFSDLWSLPQGVHGPSAAFYVWWGVIGVGSAACVWLMVRAARQGLGGAATR